MKKRYKLKKKNVYIVLFVILIFIVVIFGKPTVNIFKLMLNDYSFDESVNIYKSGEYLKVLKKEYNFTIANVINKEEYLSKNFDLYYEIDYVDSKDFLTNVNKWLELGYSTKDINVINEKKDSMLNSYLLNNYVPHIDRWIKYEYFKVEYFDRYLKFFDGDYGKTIVNVNIGLDKPFYEDVDIISEYSVDVLANKYNKLDSSFVPLNLTPLDNCSGSGHFLAKDAKIAYDELCSASLNDGMSIFANSSYRSYEDQENIYQYYLDLYGKSYVEKYVATPGYSEHQTGLALDVKSSKSNIFKNSEEYKWMIDNSYKYGFILRYPEGKSEITGYDSEAWHFRYVGKDAAKYIYENDLTYDEYYVMFLDK